MTDSMPISDTIDTFTRSWKRTALPTSPKPEPVVYCLGSEAFDAGIPPEYHGAELREDLRDLLRDNRIGLYLHGAPGTGKTREAWAMVRADRTKRHLAEIQGIQLEPVAQWSATAKAYQWVHPIGQEGWEREYIERMTQDDRVRIITECADIRRHRHDRDWLDSMANWNGWLVVDDIGFATPDSWTTEALYHLANVRRSYRRPTCWTSNLDADALTKAYGPAIASRLMGGTVVNLGGEDRRILE